MQCQHFELTDFEEQHYFYILKLSTNSKDFCSKNIFYFKNQSICH